MTVHRFGSITGEEATGGLVDIGTAILLDDVITVAIEPRTIGDDGVTTQPAAVALNLAGRINRTTDRVDAVYLIPAEDAAGLAAEVLSAIYRALGDDGLSAALDVCAHTVANRSTE